MSLIRNIGGSNEGIVCVLLQRRKDWNYGEKFDAIKDYAMTDRCSLKVEGQIERREQ